MKYFKFVLLLIILVLLQIVQYGQEKYTENKNTTLEYKFEYQFQGEATGVILLFFRYRFFFYANTSVLFKAKKIKDDTLFDFLDIDKTAYMLRTYGFGGKMLITAATDNNLSKARGLIKNGFSILKEKTPYYSRFIKRQKAYLYELLPKGDDSIRFIRKHDGIHEDCHLDLQVKPLEYDEKYAIYFKIFPMLIEMIKIYNHSFLPEVEGKKKAITMIKPGQEWLSPPLDFSSTINQIGAQATDVVEKYVTFRQESPFRLKYKVESIKNGVVCIIGKAIPQVKIWDGYKLWQVIRTVSVRPIDNVILEDKYAIEIKKGKDKGGFAQCSLTLIK